MADPRGFLKYSREDNPKRPIEERRTDWHELYASLTEPATREGTQTQAARCMDCGIPFCHSGGAGCPLGNLIPEWNDFVRRGEWDRASERLHATNNFPEFTGALCPAPCEAACVLSITSQPGPVAIKRVEWSIAENGWSDGHVVPQMPSNRSGRRVAVVGSGPAGLAAAQQLTRAGHDVTVFERDDRLGGLMRYGIPEFKFEKWELDRRLDQMRAEGTRFVTNCEVGTAALPVERLQGEHDAVVLAVGALEGRDDRTIEGRDLDGVHLAMEYLVPANRECEGDGPSPINARGANVVIIGGGDTGADCYGTATRQGALAVHQLDQYPPPPKTRQDSSSPWPTWPYVFRTPPALEEGGERLFATAVRRFVGDERGHVRAVELSSVEVRRDADGSAGGRADLGGGARDAVRPRAVLHRLHGPRRPGAPARPRDRAQPQGRGRLRLGLADRRAGRVRLRRRPPRCVADRVGDRRGPLGRRGRRPLPRPRRQHRPPRPPAPRRAAPDGVAEMSAAWRRRH